MVKTVEKKFWLEVKIKRIFYYLLFSLKFAHSAVNLHEKLGICHKIVSSILLILSYIIDGIVFELCIHRMKLREFTKLP